MPHEMGMNVFHACFMPLFMPNSIRHKPIVALKFHVLLQMLTVATAVQAELAGGAADMTATDGAGDDAAAP